MELVTYTAAFFAGMVCIASPCCFPMIPGVLAYSAERNRLTPLAIVLGISLAFTAMGVISALLGYFFLQYVDYIKLFSGIFIVAMGLYMLFTPLENAFLRLCQCITVHRPVLTPVKDQGLLGGILLGSSLGIVWAPCIGPILASILMVVARNGDMAHGGLLLLAYSLGFSIPMLALAYSSSAISIQLRKISKYSYFIKIAAGIILVMVGFYFIWATGVLQLIF